MFINRLPQQLVIHTYICGIGDAACQYSGRMSGNEEISRITLLSICISLISNILPQYFFRTHSLDSTRCRQL